MKYLHTMVRVKNIEESIDFYCNKLGLKEVRRKESEKGRFTLIFLGAENKLFWSFVTFDIFVWYLHFPAFAFCVSWLDKFHI